MWLLNHRRSILFATLIYLTVAGLNAGYFLIFEREALLGKQAVRLAEQPVAAPSITPSPEKKKAETKQSAGSPTTDSPNSNNQPTNSSSPTDQSADNQTATTPNSSSSPVKENSTANSGSPTSTSNPSSTSPSSASRSTDSVNYQTGKYQPNFSFTYNKNLSLSETDDWLEIEPLPEVIIQLSSSTDSQFTYQTDKEILQYDDQAAQREFTVNSYPVRELTIHQDKYYYAVTELQSDKGLITASLTIFEESEAASTDLSNPKTKEQIVNYQSIINSLTFR